MTIDFYFSLSEPVELNKVLQSSFSIEGTLRNDSPVSNPSIFVELTDPALLRVNYARIPDFNRYYYIKEITHVREKLWQVDMKCDVLMSFKDGIRISTAIVESNSLPGIQDKNKYMPSDSYQTLVKKKTDIIQFESGFNDLPYFILITAGGIVS